MHFKSRTHFFILLILGFFATFHTTIKADVELSLHEFGLNLKGYEVVPDVSINQLQCATAILRGIAVPVEHALNNNNSTRASISRSLIALVRLVEEVSYILGHPQDDHTIDLAWAATDLVMIYKNIADAIKVDPTIVTVEENMPSTDNTVADSGSWWKKPIALSALGEGACGVFSSVLNTDSPSRSPGRRLIFAARSTMSLLRLLRDYYATPADQEAKQKLYLGLIALQASYSALKLSIADFHDNRTFDANGYDQHGYNQAGYDKNGFNASGHDPLGYNRAGFNKHGTHRNGTRYDDEGFDKKGYDKYYRTKSEYDAKGFTTWGRHKNGTLYDDEGYDKDGYNADGYNRAGYDRYGRRNPYWTSSDGFDSKGFDRRGVHRNGTRYDDEGFDKDGYNNFYFRKTDFDAAGFNTAGFHKNGTFYDDEGYKKDGYNAAGYNRAGYDRYGTRNPYGTSSDGYNSKGFHSSGTHKNGTKYDENGYDHNGYDKNGKTFFDNFFGSGFFGGGTGGGYEAPVHDDWKKGDIINEDVVKHSPTIAKQRARKNLGVAPNADKNTIKTTYRKKAMELHTDKTRNLPEPERKAAEHAFQVINQANEILTKPTGANGADDSMPKA